MEFVFALPLVLLPLVLPYLAGQMAKSFGRKFWPWFFLGIPLPIITHIILLCLPDKSKEKQTTFNNQKSMNHLFITRKSQEQTGPGNQFAA